MPPPRSKPFRPATNVFLRLVKHLCWARLITSFRTCKARAPDPGRHWRRAARHAARICRALGGVISLRLGRWEGVSPRLVPLHSRQHDAGACATLIVWPAQNCVPRNADPRRSAEGLFRLRYQSCGCLSGVSSSLGCRTARRPTSTEGNRIDRTSVSPIASHECTTSGPKTM